MALSGTGVSAAMCAACDGAPLGCALRPPGPAAARATALGRVLLSLLAAGAGAWGPARLVAAGDAPVDVVFLLDSSASIFRNDPLKAREFVMEAIAGSWRGAPGDRVGVGRFGGWKETSEQKEVILPLTEIPKGVAARGELVSKIRSRVAAATSAGTASDVNAALDLALSEVAGAERGPERKLWAVVITDGDMNVIEGDSVRQEYVDAAKQLYDRVDPETLGRAATEVLFTKTLPALEQRGVGVSLLGIGCDAKNPGQLFERGRTELKGGVFCADGPFLRDTLAGLVGNNPVRAVKGVLSHGFLEPTVPAGSEVDVPFKVLPGTLRSQVVIFASSGEFDAALLDAEGAPPEGVRFHLLGKGRPYRVGWIDGAAPGDYKLRLTSRAASELKAEVAVFCRAAVRLKVAWPADLDPHLMNIPVGLEVQVLDSEGGVVEDPGLLKEARVAFALRDEGDKVVMGAAPLADAAKGPTGSGVLISIPTEGFRPGKCTASVRLEAFLKDPQNKEGPFLYTRDPESCELRLVPGVLVEFGREEVLLGQEVTVRAVATSDLEAPPAELSVVVRKTGLEPGAEAAREPMPGALMRRTVKLKPATVVPGRTAYVGIVSFDRPGKWKILPGGDAGFLVRPGETSEVEVRALQLRILSAEPPHEPLESLAFEIPYCEKSGPDSEGSRLPVLIDLAAAEGGADAALSARFVPSESLLEFQKRLEAKPPDESGAPPAPDLPISLAISAEGEKDAQGRMKGTISLTVDTEEALPLHPGMEDPWQGLLALWPVPKCEPGSLNIEAVVESEGEGELKLAKEVPVAISFPDFWGKAIRIYAKYWIPVAAALALLLLLLIWCLLRAKFDEHQLRLAESIGKQGGGFYRLRNLGEGRSRRRAIGTPEVVDAVRFRIKGSRLFGRGRVDTRPMADECRVFVNRTDSGEWSRLTHGDLVGVENGEGQSCSYYYFEHTPTPEELESIAKGYFVVLGPDDFVIEGLP